MKSFIKKNIRFIIIIVICITCSVLTTFATDYLFNSNEVYYNNTTSGIQADKVQGAIDELYACASNYAAYNQRLTSAETTIGSGSLTTTSQNLIGAVNGLNEQIGTLSGQLGSKFDSSKIKHGSFSFGSSNGTVTISNNYTGTLPSGSYYTFFTPTQFSNDYPTVFEIFFDGSSSSSNLKCKSNLAQTVRVHWVQFTF